MLMSLLEYIIYFSVLLYGSNFLYKFILYMKTFIDFHFNYNGSLHNFLRMIFLTFS